MLINLKEMSIMELFPGLRGNKELTAKVDSFISRTESQLAALSEQVAGLNEMMRGFVDGQFSFNFPAQGSSLVKGYRLYPDYGTPVDVDTLSPQDRAREITRKRIADLVFIYAGLRGLSTNDSTAGNLYKYFYNRLERATGYRPKKATVYRYIGPVGRKVFTVIEDGYADMLIALIQKEIDSLRSPKIGVRLSLNPAAKSAEYIRKRLTGS